MQPIKKTEKPKTHTLKQKTAYEIMPSLVGSEMCIRDRFVCWCTAPFVSLVLDLKSGGIALTLLGAGHSPQT